MSTSHRLLVLLSLVVLLGLWVRVTHPDLFADSVEELSQSVEAGREPEQRADSDGSVIATLDVFQKPASFRRHQDLVWAEASQATGFYPFDALRTGERGSAEVALVSGSHLFLDEMSLVVFNPLWLDGSKRFDRAVVRKGSIRGQTSDELWILTSAALLILKSKAKSEPAQVRIAMAKSNQIEFKLISGAAVAFRKGPEGISPKDYVVLSEVRPTSMASVADAVDLGEREGHWPSKEQALALAGVTAQELARLLQTPDSTRTPASILLSSPSDYQEVFGGQIEVSGKVSGVLRELLINDRNVSIDSNGQFRSMILLQPGANSVTVQGVRDHGPPIVQQRTVLRRD